MPYAVNFVSGFVQGLAGAASIAGTGATLAGHSVGFFLAGSSLASIAVKTVISRGISQAIARSRRTPSQDFPSERLVNFSQPVTYLEYALGRTRKGGPLGFTCFRESTDVVTGTPGPKRHNSVVLAAHPCEAVVTHYLDDREIELDGDGLVTTAPMAGYYRIRPFLGGPGQTADAEMVATFSEITSSHDFAGLTGAHFWARRPSQADFSEIYPTGREGQYTPVIDGANNVYDPRDASTGHSRNAALLIAWWIVNILGQSVDWDEVAEEANVCDEVVTNAEGGSQPRWRVDGVIRDDQEFEDQRAALAVACDAWFYERPDGSLGFKVGRYIAPTVVLTDRDFLMIEVVEGDSGRNWPTEISGIYVEPDNLWREAPSGAIVLESTARQVREEVPVLFSSSHNQTARVLKRIGAVMRAQYRIKAHLGPVGALIAGQRFIRIQTLGVDAVFEIEDLTEIESGLGYEISAFSVTPDDWSFDASTEEPARPEFQEAASDNTVTTPGGLSVTAADGPVLSVSWTAQDASLTQQVRWSLSGAGTWQTVDVPAGDSSLTLAAVVDGSAYDVQIRNRTSAGRVSSWTSTVTATAVANSAAPATLTAFAAAVDGADVDVTLTAPSDANYYAARIYRADYAAGYSGPYDIADGAIVRTEYGLPGNDDAWTDTGPATGHYAYWAVPINASGVAGGSSGPQTVDIP